MSRMGAARHAFSTRRSWVRDSDSTRASNTCLKSSTVLAERAVARRSAWTVASVFFTRCWSSRMRSVWCSSDRLRSWRYASASRWRCRARVAHRTALTRTEGWNGRSSTVTLPSRSVTPTSAWPPRDVSSTNGKSDQGSCWRIQPASALRSEWRRASSVTIAPPAQSRPDTRVSRSGQTVEDMPTSPRIAAATAASRPEGARIRTGAVCSSIALAPLQKSSVLTLIRWNPGQDPAELDQTLTHPHTTAVNPELADRVLVRPGPLLDHRRSTSDLSTGFKEAQQQNGVAEVGQIQRRSHVAHHAGLRQDQDGHHALLVQIGQQLMHLQDHELLVRHGVQVPAQAVDHHHPGTPALDGVAHLAGELAGREIGRVDLLQAQPAVLDVRREIHPDPGRPSST